MFRVGILGYYIPSQDNVKGSNIPFITQGEVMT